MSTPRPPSVSRIRASQDRRAFRDLLDRSSIGEGLTELAESGTLCTGPALAHTPHVGALVRLDIAQTRCQVCHVRLYRSTASYYGWSAVRP